MSACVVDTRPPGEREETASAGLSTAPNDPTGLGTGAPTSGTGKPDPAAPRTQSGPPHEPDPSPWKGGNVEVPGPSEPDPSPWRRAAEAELH